MCLQIITRDLVVVLPWYRFLYADGTPNTVRIQFASHTVVVEGGGLLTLLSAINAQRLAILTEPTENEARFRAGAGIDKITVNEQE